MEGNTSHCEQLATCLGQAGKWTRWSCRGKFLSSTTSCSKETFEVLWELPHTVATQTSNHLYVRTLVCTVLKCVKCTNNTIHTSMTYNTMQCNALHCTVLHCIALHCTALHCTALHCIALHCTCNTIQYNTIQYNTIQYNTIQYNTIQYNTHTQTRHLMDVF